MKEKARSVFKDDQLESPSGPVGLATPPDAKLHIIVGSLTSVKISPTENM